jgi:predicted glutamine amidotransferase
MCVIIKREPKIIIPDEKIASACHVNSDGWGISVVDRGQLTTQKFHDPKGTKPEEVIKALKEAEDNLVFLHLRYTTAGKTNADNCHPFEVFKGDNFEVQFMHNGTLNKFSKGKNNDYSDTYHFTQEILKPLVRAFYEVDGASVLSNPTLKTILDEFRGLSAFALYDNEGNSLLCENTSCKQFEGWWASNEYSFNRYHRSPAAADKSGSWWDDNDNYSSPYGGYTRYPRSYSPSKPGSSQTPVANAPTKPVSTKDQCKKIGYALMQAKRQNAPVRALTPPTKRLTFTELSDLNNLKEVMVLTEGDIYDICVELPLAATALIMDLIYELWEKDQKNKLEETKAAAEGKDSSNVTTLPAVSSRAN